MQLAFRSGGEMVNDLPGKAGSQQRVRPDRRRGRVLVSDPRATHTREPRRESNNRLIDERDFDLVARVESGPLHVAHGDDEVFFLFAHGEGAEFSNGAENARLVLEARSRE